MTLASLTSCCQEENKELMKLRKEVGELLGLRKKLARYASLKERLIKTEEWSIRAKDQLAA